MIFVIDDDEIMAEMIGKAAASETSLPVQFFADGIAAMNAIAKGQMPQMIFLDILLNGPDGFTFLNEMVSYSDTAKIPIVIVSSLDFSQQNLSEYGVVEILNKDTMTPKDIKRCAREYL